MWKVSFKKSAACLCVCVYVCVKVVPAGSAMPAEQQSTAALTHLSMQMHNMHLSPPPQPPPPPPSVSSLPRDAVRKRVINSRRLPVCPSATYLLWRRSVVSYGFRVKLFQAPRKINFTFHFWHKPFILDDVKPVELSYNSFERKNVTF